MLIESMLQSETPEKSNPQRGKRKSARLFEIAALILLGFAAYGYKEAQSVFTIAFPLMLTYSGSLRGLDAKWPSDRLLGASGLPDGGNLSEYKEMHAVQRGEVPRYVQDPEESGKSRGQTYT